MDLWDDNADETYRGLNESMGRQYRAFVRYQFSSAPRPEKTGLRGFRPGPTQTGLYNHTRLLEA